MGCLWAAEVASAVKPVHSHVKRRAVMVEELCSYVVEVSGRRRWAWAEVRDSGRSRSAEKVEWADAEGLVEERHSSDEM